MTEAASTLPTVTANDRLGMTLFFALLVHGIVILGVTFISSPSARQKIPPTLDVILVNTSNSETPDEADYLAQTTQDGGGSSEEKVRRTDLFSAPTLSQQPGIAQQQSITMTPVVKQQKQLAFLTALESDEKIRTEKKQQNEETQNNPVTQQQKNEMAARMAEELSLTFQEYSQRPKEKFLNSRTREYFAATYMRQWVDRVERLGNADYPDAAIRNKLSGTLILDVSINSDGTLKEISLRRSSGHQVLDDAAKRIVRMSSPFDPFPAKLQQQADIIHITRSWEFQSNYRLRSY